MPTIPITIRDRVASAPPDAYYVTGNNDYTATFDFDAEWSAHPTKTARFSTETQFIDIVFTGAACPVPQFGQGRWMRVGVFAGALSTTTNASIRMREGVLEGDGLPAPPVPDVYEQLMTELDRTQSAALSAIEEAEAAAAEAREAAGTVSVDAEAVERAKETAVQAAADATGAAAAADDASREAALAAERAALDRASIEEDTAAVRDAAQQTEAYAASAAEDAISAEAAARIAQSVQNSMVFLKFGYGPDGDLRIYNMNLLAEHPEFRLNYKSGALEVAV